MMFARRIRLISRWLLRYPNAVDTVTADAWIKPDTVEPRQVDIESATH